MTVLVITRGLPASGKTTYAKAWVAVDPQNRVRINRDDIRDMAHDGVFLKGGKGQVGTERAILRIRDNAIKGLLSAGVNVICDDTNLPQRTVDDLRALANSVGAEVEIVDLTNVDIDTCFVRDANRIKSGQRGVGAAVITRMYNDHVKGKPYPLPDEKQEFELKPYAEEYSHTKSTCILVDIDGTVALRGDRSAFDESRVIEDSPNTKVVKVVRGLYGLGYDVVFMSGRSEDCRFDTEQWLAEHFPDLQNPPLYMRKSGDKRKDWIVKYELFNAHIRDMYNVLCVFDDRNQVVDMWRKIGLTVMQVAPGDF